jgi:hypothetical protein
MNNSLIFQYFQHSASNKFFKSCSKSCELSMLTGTLADNSSKFRLVCLDPVLYGFNILLT